MGFCAFYREPEFCPQVHDLCSLLFATKIDLVFLPYMAPELSRGKIQFLGHVTPLLLALRGMSLLR